MHEKDRNLIQSVKDFFGGIGSISIPNKNFTVEFRVSALKDLINVIFPHFDNYPLITKKHSDYLLFKQIVLLMLNKEHASLEGIQKILNIKVYLNKGLSASLKKVFAHTIPMNKLEGRNENNTLHENLHPEWVAGFTTGESNFFIAVQRSKTKSGISASLRFTIAQHSKDVLLLENFINLFGGGRVVSYKNRALSEFIVAKSHLIVYHIIPFFDKYPILGSKHLNYLDFNSASYIINNKEHLNENGVGLGKILQLKNRITSRSLNNVIKKNTVLK